MEGKRLIHLVASSVWGGAERYALDLLTAYRDKGWSVTAYTRDAKAVDSLFIAEGIDLRHAPLQGLADLESAWILASHLRGESMGTVVHTHRYRDAVMALIARKIARRPDVRIINTRHTVAPARHPHVLRWAYEAIDSHIFVSRLARDRFLSSFLSAESVKIRQNSIVIPNWIKSISSPVDEPKKGPVIVMYHGRLIPGKGIETLIDAATRFKGKRTRLRIVGSGNPDYIDTLRRRAQARGVNDLIDWTKYAPEPAELIASAHIGVMPSVMPEAFGIPILEYMAAGRPVVTTFNGAQPEYISNGEEGFLVSPADAQSLGEAILHLATNPDLRRVMGARGHLRVASGYGWKSVEPLFDKTYFQAGS